MTRCRNCDSDNLELVLDLGKQPWGNHFVSRDSDIEVPRFPLELFYCNDCKMIQIGYTVPKETMFVEHSYVSGTTKSLRNHFAGVADRIMDFADFSDGRYILDVGGNDGTFLKNFVERGIPVLNVDPGKLQAARSEAAGVRCKNTFFNLETAKEILAEFGKAEVIHGSGVFFHLEELHSALEGVKLLLAGNGSVVIEFIYLPSMVRGGAFDQVYHEHLVYYTLHTLNRLLERHGLALSDAEMVEIHGGSCVAVAQHKDVAQPTARLKGLLRQEIDEGFESIRPYLAFAERAAGIRDGVRKLVAEKRAAGKTIHALGAPVKGSTIVNYCGFTEAEIERAVEINSLKCGTWFPGTRIPVDHQDEVAAPDVYLLLSWNFRDEILRKLGDFFDAGGEVLVPIPEPEMVDKSNLNN